MKYELGTTKVGLIKRIWAEVKTVIKTWKHCKDNNLEFDEWVAIYEKGTNNIVANMGPSSLSLDRAYDIHYALKDKFEEDK